jgi:hypothetical protein
VCERRGSGEKAREEKGRGLASEEGEERWEVVGERLFFDRRTIPLSSPQAAPMGKSWTAHRRQDWPTAGSHNPVPIANEERVSQPLANGVLVTRAASQWQAGR